MDHYRFTRALSGLVSVAKGVLQTGTGEGIRHAGRFLSSAIMDWTTLVAWMEWQADYCQQQQLSVAPSSVVRKPVDAYFARSIDRKARFDLVRNHYQLAAMSLPPLYLRALWSGETVDLGHIAGKKRNYHLKLLRSDLAATRQEGELALLLECSETKLALCRVTYLFTTIAGQVPTVAIGGLQGASSPEAKQNVIFATRDLGGLRPKDALLLAVAAMASGLGANSVLAVNNSEHVTQTRRSRRKRTLSMDYDSYFTERGGEPAGPYGFSIPIKAPCAVSSTRRDATKREFWNAGRALLLDRRENGDREPEEMAALA